MRNTRQRGGPVRPRYRRGADARSQQPHQVLARQQLAQRQLRLNAAERRRAEPLLPTPAAAAPLLPPPPPEQEMAREETPYQGPMTRSRTRELMKEKLQEGPCVEEEKKKVEKKVEKEEVKTECPIC